MSSDVRILASAGQTTGLAIAFFVPALIGILMLMTGYRQRRWHATNPQLPDGSRLLVFGWALTFLGVVGMLTMAAATQT